MYAGKTSKVIEVGCEASLSKRWRDAVIKLTEGTSCDGPETTYHNDDSRPPEPILRSTMGDSADAMGSFNLSDD